MRLASLELPGLPARLVVSQLASLVLARLPLPRSLQRAASCRFPAAQPDTQHTFRPLQPFAPILARRPAFIVSLPSLQRR